MKYPFVFISSTIRSGSTLMLEVLTQVPYSFILLEPSLCRNQFYTKNRNLKDILNYGIDINKILKPPILKNFKKKIIPLLEEHIDQIGVKEVWNTEWKNYLKFFPDTRIIVTGRDPRDLYISVYYWRNRNSKSPKALTNRRLSLLKNNIKKQMEMFKTGQAIKSKYEDLCRDPEGSILKIKEFIDSPIPTVGDVGKFLSFLPKRKPEFELHGNEITTSRVDRWKKEKNKDLVKWANKFFDSIPKYCEFWEYEKKG